MRNRNILFCIFLFAACTKELPKQLDKTPIETIGKCMLKSIKEGSVTICTAGYNVDNELEVLRIYNRDGSIEDERTNLYQNKKLISSNETLKGSGTFSTFEYNADGMLSKVKLARHQGGENYKYIKVEYNSLKKITNTQSYENSYGLFFPKEYATYVYNNYGNIANITVHSSNISLGEKVNSCFYDNNRNLLKVMDRSDKIIYQIEYDLTRPNFFNESIVNFYDYPNNILPKNAPVKFTSYGSSGVIDKEYSIEYNNFNSNNYPTRIQVIINEVVFVYSLDYTCHN